MDEEDLADHDLKKLPEEHDSWVEEEPGIPEWEEYMDIVKNVDEIDGEENVVIAATMVSSAYVASTFSVKLDDWL